jgi:prepilin-type N-terminal cleavage/methylation domain-containing protein
MRERAFSLIEMTMVVVIIAVVGAIALPRFNNSLANYRAGGAARRLAADLAYARSQAMTTSKSQDVIFDVPGSSYRMPTAPDPETRRAGYTVKLLSDPFQTKIVSAAFGSGGSTTVTFDVYGTPSNSGTLVIRSGATDKTIVLNATTGLATAQ